MATPTIMQEGRIQTVTTQLNHRAMCQGNGASPAAWAVTTIPMIKDHQIKGHGAVFTTPISDLNCHLIGGLYVDDTNLIHVDMRKWYDLTSAHRSLQEAINNWGQLLIATGGALKLT